MVHKPLKSTFTAHFASNWNSIQQKVGTIEKLKYASVSIKLLNWCGVVQLLEWQLHVKPEVHVNEYQCIYSSTSHNFSFSSNVGLSKTFLAAIYSSYSLGSILLKRKHHKMNNF